MFQIEVRFTPRLELEHLMNYLYQYYFQIIIIDEKKLKSNLFHFSNNMIFNEISDDNITRTCF